MLKIQRKTFNNDWLCFNTNTKCFLLCIIKVVSYNRRDRLIRFKPVSPSGESVRLSIINNTLVEYISERLVTATEV